MVPQLTGHGEGQVPEALESPPLEDGGGKEGWLRPPFRGQAEPLTCPSQTGLYSGWLTQHRGKGAWQLLSPSQGNLSHSPLSPLLSQNPGHQMARAGCVYLGPWKSAASFSYPSGSGTGLESSRKATMPQNGADLVSQNPRARDLASLP